jgi:APA family basic amino acid/polyamine antiporter
MIQSGSIAALSVAFAIYINHIVHLTLLDQKVLSVACIFALTTINCFGIRGGKLTQNLIASAKIIGLASIILLLWIRGSRPIHFFETPGVGGSAASLTGIGIALVAVMFAYEGWHVVSFVAGEMKRPQLDLPRGLVYGTLIVMLIYVAANFGYYRLLSSGEIRGSDALAAYAVGKVLGPGASIVISSLILISILGSMNGLVLTGPRAYFAMARNGAFPRVFGELSSHYRTPVIALIVQGGWAAILAISGSYQQLFTAVIFTAWIFYGLAVAAVLVLRRTEPCIERRFRVPGYPWVSILFCAAAVGLVLSTVVERPGGAAIGVGLVAIGIPVYFYLVRRSTNRTPA